MNAYLMVHIPARVCLFMLTLLLLNNFSGDPVSAQTHNSALDLRLSCAVPVENCSKEIAQEGISDQEMDGIVREEMKRLDKITFPTPLMLNDTNILASSPEQGIIVGRGKLRSIMKKSGVEQFRAVVRVLLAHEKAHQVQYREYPTYATLAAKSADIDDPAEIEQMRIYECQADILSGKYLIETLAQPQATDGQSIRDALRVAFALGAENNSSFHAPKEQRRTAVRRGMASGMIINFQTQPPFNAVLGSIAVLVDKLDVRQGEVAMQWSLRQARRIIHYNLDASKNLTLESEDHHFNTNPNTPFVSFELTYKNSGKRPIRVDLEVQCSAVPRDKTKREDTMYWQLVSVKNSAFTLMPGEQHTVSGLLRWDGYTDNSLMPRIIYPSDPIEKELTALVSCEFGL